MDQKTLLLFAKRILNSSSRTKASLSLCQLKTLLEEQNAPQSNIDLLQTMLASMPELQDVAQKPVLTEEDVEIAARRASARRLREAEASSRGRC